MAGWWTRTMRRLGSSSFVGKLAPKVMPPIDRFLNRVSGGRIHMMGDLLPTLMLTSIGRRSGQPREQPLAYVVADDGWAVVGTNYGQDNHPAWTHNLVANPEATVQIDRETYEVTARLLEPGSDERRELWDRFVQMWPPYQTYLERTDRQPRLFLLERR